MCSPANYTTSQQVIVSLNDEARTPAVQLGWWQMIGSQTGAFAIDNVLIGSSASSEESSIFYNDTYVTYSYWFGCTCGCTMMCAAIPW